MPARPPSSVPAVLGALNITFGAILLCCGGFSLLQSAIVMPMMSSAMTAEIEAEQAARVAELRNQQAQARTEQERASLETQIQAAQSAPDAAGASASMAVMGVHPALIGYNITDAASGMILNLLLVVSGVGLLLTRAWGRTLALWVAGIKIFRLVALKTVYVIVAVPLTLESMHEALQPGPAGGGPSQDEFVMMFGLYYLVQAVAIVIFGSIYPAILLWLLNTRGVRERFVRG